VQQQGRTKNGNWQHGHDGRPVPHAMGMVFLSRFIYEVVGVVRLENPVMMHQRVPFKRIPETI